MRGRISIKGLIIFAAVAAAVAAIVLFLVYGVFSQPKYDIFYIEIDDDGVVSYKPAKYAVSSDSDRDRAYRLLAKLISGPDGGASQSPIPEGTRINANSFTLGGNGVAHVDFSAEYLDNSGFMLAVCDYCVFKTLAGAGGVSEVLITVSGKPHPYYGGEAVSLSSFIENSRALAYENADVALYYPSAAGGTMERTTKQARLYENRSGPELALELLFAGPLCPSAVSFHSLSIEKGLATVDLPMLFLSGTGSESEFLLRLYCVVNTLTEFRSVSSVRFLFDGQEEVEYAGVRLAPAYSRSLDMVAE